MVNRLTGLAKQKTFRTARLLRPQDHTLDSVRVGGKAHTHVVQRYEPDCRRRRNRQHIRMILPRKTMQAKRRASLQDHRATHVIESWRSRSTSLVYYRPIDRTECIEPYCFEFKLDYATLAKTNILQHNFCIFCNGIFKCWV